MKKKVITGLLAGIMLMSQLTVYAADVTITDGKGTGNTTLTGTVSAVTTMDVTIPVGGINFTIDSDSNISAQGIVITSNTAIPISVSVLEATSLEAGDTTDGLVATTLAAPTLIAANTYTDEQWNNLTKAETASQIAIALKQVDVTAEGAAGTALTEATTDAMKVTTPVQLGDLEVNKKLAHLESGYGEASKVGINLETDTAYTNYGKAWVGDSNIVFRYLTTLEFAFDN